MKKGLQDLVWAVLPKEFKEEVKKYYRTLHEQYKEYDGLHFETAIAKVQERIVTIEYFFGGHNLTSDAEGEEMLMVEKRKVQGIYAQCEEIEMDDNPNLSADIIEAAGAKMGLLDDLFGSKCLPDEEQPKQKDCDNPLADKEGCRWRNDGKCTFDSACYFEPLNPQEPKFKLGDIVRFKYSCTPYRIDVFKMLDGAMLYQVGEVWAEESDLEPYPEPEGDTSPNVNHSDIDIDELVAKGYLPDPAKQFDNIIKDNFRAQKRLQIAAMAMQGLLASPVDANMQSKSVDYITDASFEYADALISKSKKGGLNENN